MANELTMSGSVKFAKSGTSVLVDFGTIQMDVAGSQYIHMVQSVPTSEEAINLGTGGEIAAGGMFCARNLSTTNFVSIRQATGAADLVRLDPLDFCIFRLDDDATAPFWIADTAACEVEYLIIEP